MVCSVYHQNPPSLSPPAITVPTAAPATTLPAAIVTPIAAPAGTHTANVAAPTDEMPSC